MGAHKMVDLTISTATQLVREKKISPVELTEECLNRIDRLNPILNAFITVTHDSAIAQAREAEAEILQGNWRGPLHGIPIGLKDLIDTKGVRTTCGSALFSERVPLEDAEVVVRLKRAGAVLVGKQNMQEFAYGGTSASSHFGPVCNPWDIKRIAGGSSGGSAAAVASGMCFGAIGTDTGGSIREPASFCGIVGLKPTYGRVSTRGVFPLSWSLDHVGPLCRTVKDVAIMLEAIAGYDALDVTSVDWPTQQYGAPLYSRSRVRTGLVRYPFFNGIDPEIEHATTAALEVLQTIGAEVVEVELPDIPNFVQAPEVLAVHEKYFRESPELYRGWMQERLKQASAINTVSYVKDRHELDRVRRVVNEVFTNVDLLLTPTVAVSPITIDEALKITQPPLAGELWLRNTRPFNVYGLPTISIPCGFTHSGLPIGLQIAASKFDERQLLAFADSYEQATEWHKFRPRPDDSSKPATNAMV